SQGDRRLPPWLGNRSDRALACGIPSPGPDWRLSLSVSTIRGGQGFASKVTKPFQTFGKALGRDSVRNFGYARVPWFPMAHGFVRTASRAAWRSGRELTHVA